VVVADADDQVATLALIGGADIRLAGRNDGIAAVRERLREAASVEYRDPFNGDSITFEAAAELCGSWRNLVDSNRKIGMAIGFAFWKRRTVAPLLWGGEGDVRFSSRFAGPVAGESAAVWRSKADVAALDELDRNGTRIIEVEDGFIRSSGLGADCVPPLSIVVDPLGIYFDPSRPSKLERLLQEEDFSAELVERARRLRELIVELGVTKYDSGEIVLSRGDQRRRQLLAVGQVDDDRAVTSGGGPRTNLDLLRKIRTENPDAYVLYKPHPDVEAGHRPGAIREEIALEFANEIVRDAPISSLFSSADEIHVNTSLAGFEGLLRGKPVTTYGVPFYAGWGLTRDLGPVPARRTARRSLDELTAAALIQYARYLDPVTRLPCPPEILVRRLGQDQANRGQSGIVRLRKLQGRWNRAVSALRRSQ
jgi:capsular polysaccharide export protein